MIESLLNRTPVAANVVARQQAGSRCLNDSQGDRFVRFGTDTVTVADQLDTMDPRHLPEAMRNIVLPRSTRELAEAPGTPEFVRLIREFGYFVEGTHDRPLDPECIGESPNFGRSWTALLGNLSRMTPDPQVRLWLMSYVIYAMDPEQPGRNSRYSEGNVRAATETAFELCKMAMNEICARMRTPEEATEFWHRMQEKLTFLPDSKKQCLGNFVILRRSYLHANPPELSVPTGAVWTPEYWQS